ncbi:MAG: reactive intermediate/imine deaminase [Gammaproteobacteria bacterium]|jgi:reactive intermediate/imine deaminase
MSRKIITTDKAPAAIGTYSQAVKIDNIVYLSGQIPLSAETMSLISENFREQITQVFTNLAIVAEAAGATLNDAVKLTIYLTNLENFNEVNEVMSTFFQEPFPARAVIGVSELPKNSLVEIDAILHLTS